MSEADRGNDLRLVTVSLPDEDTARRIARDLVEARLAACVNIVPGVISVYRWRGEISEDREVVAHIKTTAARLPALIDAVVRLHPYDQPAIEAVAVAIAGPGVAGWVRDETGG